jgi:hypothetical protein
LEFHHVKPKQSKVARLVSVGASEARLRRELARCQVMCANCHRRLEARRRGEWRLDWNF